MRCPRMSMRGFMRLNLSGLWSDRLKLIKNKISGTSKQTGSDAQAMARHKNLRMERSYLNVNKQQVADEIWSSDRKCSRPAITWTDDLQIRQRVKDKAHNMTVEKLCSCVSSRRNYTQMPFHHFLRNHLNSSAAAPVHTGSYLACHRALSTKAIGVMWEVCVMHAGFLSHQSNQDKEETETWERCLRAGGKWLIFFVL